jgi:hypothetical protein
MFSKYQEIFFPISLAIIANLLIYTLGIVPSQPKNKMIPPGYIVGSIWMVLFGLLGYIHHRLAKYSSYASISIYVFIGYSLSYPFFTRLENTDIYNKMAWVLAFLCSLLLYYENRVLIPYILPLLAWVTYVNIVA